MLRKAFDDEESPYLPKVRHAEKPVSVAVYDTKLLMFLALQHILYRQKEQFSDGVGYSWIDGLKAHAAKHVVNLSILLVISSNFALACRSLTRSFFAAGD